MSLPTEIVQAFAASLPVGETTRTTCPKCCAPEKSFAITRDATGLLFICHRAGCGFHGRLAETGNWLHAQVADDFKKLPPLADLVLDIPGPILEKLPLSQRQLTTHGVMYDLASKAVVFRISGLDYSNGLLFRWYDGRVPKCKLYGAPLGSHYGSNDRRSLIIVEDCVSAIVLATLGHSAVACLGTNLSPKMLKEASKMGYRKFMVMLDPDAAHLTYKYCTLYNGLVDTIVPAIVPADPKDMVSEHLDSLIHEIKESELWNKKSLPPVSTERLSTKSEPREQTLNSAGRDDCFIERF